MDLREQVHDLGILGDGVDQQCAMAMRRVSFETQERTRLFGRKVEHLHRLRDRLGKFELTAVNALQVCIAPRPRRSATLRGGSERAQVNIINSCFCQSIAQGVLEKPGLLEFGIARTSITRSTPAFCTAAKNSGTVVPS